MSFIFGTDIELPDDINQQKYYRIYDLLDAQLPLDVRVQHIIMYYKIRKRLKALKRLRRARDE